MIPMTKNLNNKNTTKIDKLKLKNDQVKKMIIIEVKY